MAKDKFDFMERTPDVPRTPSPGIDNIPKGNVDQGKPMFPKEFEYPSPYSEKEEGCSGKK